MSDAPEQFVLAYLEDRAIVLTFAAFALHHRALLAAAKQQIDGYVTDRWLGDNAPDDGSAVLELTLLGLWLREGEGGYRVLDATSLGHARREAELPPPQPGA